ncbi:putative UPF0481 protein At3g02645 [Silene latifolia]|uniref:putative UPF0481 protein At3g02645 n=1 Tax=Silene latifolia TaxID=37657 RepID=UPI003D779704
MAVISNKDWVISIKTKLHEEVTPSSNIKTCIYRVPVWLKQHVCDGNDETPYVPEIISFGPYYRAGLNLAEMENHKWRCLKKMLERQKQQVDEYLEEMKKLEPEVRGCYQEPVQMDSNAFVEMLVLDGCFMLEFLRVHKFGLMHLKYTFDDPVFSKSTITHVIARDMIKLENQLPIIVLKRLLEIQEKKDISERRIARLVLRALSSIWVTTEIPSKNKLKDMRKAVASDSGNELLHCLDIFRSGLLYQPTSTHVHLQSDAESDNSEINGLINSRLDELQEQQLDQAIELESFDNHVPNLRPDGEVASSENHVSSSSSEDEYEAQDSETRKNSRKMSYLENVVKRVIMMCGWCPRPYYEEIENNNSALMVYCVEDLRVAGVKFKSRNCQSFWDLKFDKQKGLLEIPPIKIDDATKTVFLNLIAYEQCHLRDFTDMQITDYAAFMDNLVNSAADVGHLHQTGIIIHQLGSDVEVADLFNRFVKKAFVDWKDGKLKNLYEELNRYCTHRRHRWRASWRNEYMTNPWVIISIIAAIVLFGATILQTVYTVFPYYIPGKS